ncbi:MAG: hypothetical protein A2Y62_22150 [Candidatus Fischerbacteria bacterium RBG_13_37_8]|uniref:Uncharacterized protein n=1 Tax=Candidatus Fischerbacteria bacterium RBG_13_37_8 TaxID=1817863 RepID=A0A1F5VX18_9BACT|nr:MAG: hypothetical protein A2Y62_22150 [Candidatus Fischerbacteria bacterium RBG_13_37_8]
MCYCENSYLYDNIFSIGGNITYQHRVDDYFSNSYSNQMKSSRSGLSLFVEGPVYTNQLGVFKIGLDLTNANNKGSLFTSDKYFINGFNVWSLMFRKTRFPLYFYYARNKGDYKGDRFGKYENQSENLIIRGKYILSRKDEFSFYVTKYSASYTNSNFTPKDNSIGILWNHKFKNIDIIQGGRLKIVEKGKSQLWAGYNYYDRNLSYASNYYSLARNLLGIFTPAAEKRHHFFVNSYNEFRSMQIYSQINYLTSGDDNIYFARFSSGFPLFSNTKSSVSIAYNLSDFSQYQNKYLDTEWRTNTSRNGIFSYITSNLYVTLRENNTDNSQYNLKAFYYNLNSDLTFNNKLKGNAFIYASRYQSTLSLAESPNYSTFGAGITLNYALSNRTDLLFEYSASIGSIFPGDNVLINTAGIGVNTRLNNKLNFSVAYSKQFSPGNSAYNGSIAKLYLQGVLNRYITYFSMNNYLQSKTYFILRNIAPRQFNSYNQINIRFNRHYMFFSGINYYIYDNPEYVTEALHIYHGSYFNINKYLNISDTIFYGKSKPFQGTNYGFDVAANFYYARITFSAGYRYVKNEQSNISAFGNKGYYFRINRAFNLSWL